MKARNERLMRKRLSTKEYVLLFTFTYFVSYITRINYGAIISEMERATEMSKVMLSMALTGSFITYGAGQIISGIFGDRFSPKKLVSFGLSITVLMNLLIPFCQTPYQTLTVWCVNGFAQAFMWPPLVKIMTILFTEDEYKNAVVKISWGSSFGTIAVYLLSPFIISVSGWKAVFFLSAICGGIMFLIWNRYCCDTGTAEGESIEGLKGTGISALLSPVMSGIMLAIILQGMLRDGVTTWMPSYISETYDLSSVIAILTNVVLPVFSIFCFKATEVLYRKKFTNPLLCAGVLFGVGMFSALAMVCLTGQNAAYSIAFSAVLTGCMHGVNLILNSMIPPFFKKSGNVSTVSGVLNSCTYIGSAISTYGIAVLSEGLGWNFTLAVWFVIAVLGTMICLVCVRPWNKRMKTEKTIE